MQWCVRSTERDQVELSGNEIGSCFAAYGSKVLYCLDIDASSSSACCCIRFVSGRATELRSDLGVRLNPYIACASWSRHASVGC